MFYKNLLKLIILTFVLTQTTAWDTEELEIFDLVEEIKENFYGILGVQQDATLQEIKRAFRNLSIVLHPDKNDAEDANIQFRNLVSIYETLKDSSKREKYDNVLKNGLPNWKSALYYYRHVRKMGLLEMSIILFVIISIGQYFVSWAAYLEKKYTAEQMFGSKLKKLQKKNKTNVNIDEILKEIPSPSIKNTLPFQIPRAIWNLPRNIKELFIAYQEQKKIEDERKQRELEEAEAARLFEEELAKEKENKGLRKRKPTFIAPEKTEEELARYSKPLPRAERINTTTKVISGGLWTDEDLTELTRLIKKYPGGTTDRWELIADALYRNVAEVTHMAAKLKENGYRVNAPSDSVAECLIPKKKEKIKKTEQIMVPEATWSQEQQQALESAIVKYPKTSSADRWQKISNSVPGKTKEECLLRYKYLVELVKMQRQQAQEPLESPAEPTVAEPEPEQLTESESKSNIAVEDVKPIKKSKNKKSQQQINDEEPQHNKGKKKNLRKERKRNMEFSTDDESDFDNEEDDV